MSDEQKYFARAEDAKKAGWFSRRHRTSAAHDAAKEARRTKRNVSKPYRPVAYFYPGNSVWRVR